MKPSSPFSVIQGGAADPAPAGMRPSRSKPFDLRLVGPPPSRRRAPPMITRHQAKEFWAALLERRCDDREHVAELFKVTFQTACNWWDGYVVPSGDKVMIAVKLWPEEFGLAADQDQRRAA